MDLEQLERERPAETNWLRRSLTSFRSLDFFRDLPENTNAAAAHVARAIVRNWDDPFPANPLVMPRQADAYRTS